MEVVTMPCNPDVLVLFRLACPSRAGTEIESTELPLKRRHHLGQPRTGQRRRHFYSRWSGARRGNGRCNGDFGGGGGGGASAAAKTSGLGHDDKRPAEALEKQKKIGITGYIPPDAPLPARTGHQRQRKQRKQREQREQREQRKTGK